MRALTEEQERAVTRRSQSLDLSAAAGSGKTSVLVERFVRAVHEDGVAPARILAMTFTERAAAELRARVRERFMALGDRRGAQETETAYVSTVHGFCSRLLRGHALALALDPDFVVLDQPQADSLRATALGRAMGELVSGPRAPEAVDLAAAWGVDRLTSSIGALHEELRSRGQRRPRLPYAPPPDRATAAAAAAAVGHAAREAARELGDQVDRPPGARVRSALRALEHAPALLATPAGRWDGAPPLGVKLAALALPSAHGALSGPACESYRQAVGAYARLCADYHGAHALGLVDELLGRFGRTYQILKRDRGAVDFDDLELLARELLLNEPRVRDAWSERFDLIMVDEFQDTNPRQLDVLRALERENLFTVGDEFQSIYGFRHADSRLVRAHRTELARRGASLALRLNFRGRPALLDVVNAAFGDRFGEGFEPLHAGREDLLLPEGEPPVELLVTDMSGWEAEPWVSEGLPPARPWRHAEARLLAQRVNELVARGEVTPGQVAVLVRASTDIPVYERALEEQGLATLAAGGGGYWSGQQVEDLLACLRVLANPLDELALYGTLACPIVGLSSDALALIAAGGRGRGGPWRVLAETFCASPHAAPSPPAGDLATSDDGEALDARLTPVDRQALARFCPWLACERDGLGRHSVADVLLRILRHSGYVEHVLGLRWGERRLANVHKLLRLAREFEASQGRDLRGFLDMAARSARGPGREPDAPVADADVRAVRLMTIHAAKGLEWDVVAVADLGRRARVEVPDVLVDGERVGLRLPTMDGSEPLRAMQYEALRAELKQRQAAEEERVLYVAMTRARERLLLSGAIELECWPRPESAAAAPLSWLGPALAQDVPTGLDVGDADQVRHPPNAGHVRVRWRVSTPARVGDVLLRRSGAREPVAPAAVLPTARVALTPGREHPAGLGEGGVEPREGATGSLSYTAIAEHERCGYRYYLERVLGLPPDQAGAPGGGDALGGRVRGALVHRLLEQVDFRRSQAPEPAQIARIGRELGLGLNETQLSDIGALTAAVAGTELGARVAAAPRIYREHPFAFALGPDLPLLTGVVDVMAHELGGTVLILDYKSDRVADVALDELVERVYLVQRHVYALAALHAGALRVDVIHWFLERPAEPVGASFDQADAGSLGAELMVRMAPLIEGRFEVTQRPHRELCLSCPGRRALCSWDETRTLAPGGGQAPARVL